MTERKRRRKGRAKDVAADSDTAPAETAPAETDAPQPKRNEPTALPAFGFAADILQRQTAPATTSDDDPAPPAAAAPEAALAGVDPADPDRIFAFADGLERQGRRRDEEEAAPQLLQGWVTLGLAGEVFALPVDAVREVLRVSAITRVPHAPHPIRGVTNLRGRVIPVIDLRRRLELPESSLERGSRIVVVESRRRLIGLLVDDVRQVLQVDLNRVQPAPDDVMTEQSDYILGVFHADDMLVLLLDVDRVLVIKEASAA